MQKTPPEAGTEKAGSVMSGKSSRVRSQPRGSGTSSSRRLQELAEEDVDYGDGGDDIRSDVQEGSEVARTIAIHTTGIVSDHTTSSTHLVT